MTRPLLVLVLVGCGASTPKSAPGLDAGPPTPDSGVDASIPIQVAPPDAAVAIDASLPDASIDAAAPDAGTRTDHCVVDAGVDPDAVPRIIGIGVVKAEGSTGSGTLSSGGAIVCGPSCPGIVDFFLLTCPLRITFEAKAEPGSVFAGWSGDCSGTDPRCTLDTSASHPGASDDPSVSFWYVQALARFSAQK